ncbi:hypothetical protein [Hyphomicrobium sp. LHD-15]|uniref:hypothetical protein n=1 Tax=Hyphomicrobium sp. LHD-15 TaxID=3072142 RepID=UPI00280FDDF7|nr:hypothetical protein [Hyphomicrobium sp. LHD-15]MDQ8700738.1 hypothetical protein [Hyphomicrobium sp. LHD-15]
MSPPTIGSEIEVRRTGKVTRYNDDNTLNVKLKEGRGRPHKVRFADILHPPTGSQPAPATTSFTTLPALAPIPPLPPLEAQEEKPNNSGRLLGIGTIVTVLGMIVAGIFHGVGVQLWSALWTAVTGDPTIGH